MDRKTGRYDDDRAPLGDDKSQVKLILGGVHDNEQNSKLILHQKRSSVYNSEVDAILWASSRVASTMPFNNSPRTILLRRSIEKINDEVNFLLVSQRVSRDEQMGSGGR